MKRSLWWMPMLLCVFLAPQGGSLLPAHAEAAGHDQPSEVLIDIDGADNPFDLVMSRIVDRLIGKDTSLRRVVITGDATVTESDFDTRLSGEYGAGWLICGSNSKSGNYPVAWGGGTNDGDDHIADFDGRFEIVFEHVHLTVRQTGSRTRLVPLKFGCNYEAGWRYSSAGEKSKAPMPGNRLQGIVVKGHLQIDFTGDADGGWVAGHIPSAKTTTPHHGSATSSVGVWEDSLMRSNLQEFDVRITSNKHDNDNIGYLISSPGWLVDRGRIVTEKNGVGLYVLGNTVGVLANGGYAENNDVNIMVGDPYTGGSVMVSDRAVKGPQFRDVRGSVPTGFKLHDYTAEGTSYANLILTSGKNITFDNVWIETGRSAAGHSIIYGGGYDSVDHLPCLFDSDRSGRCVAPSGGKIAFLNIRHIGGYISSDRRSNQWDGLTFSQNFDGHLELATLVEASDIDPSAGTDRRVFSFHPSATGVVDLSRTRTPANVLPPRYAYLKHDGTRYLRRTNAGREHRDNEGVIFDSDARGTTGRASKIYLQCGAGANMGNCWNLARISYYAYSNPRNTGCTFTPRQGRARAGSAEAIGAFGFTVGSAASNDVSTTNAGITVQVMEPIRSSNLLYLRANDTDPGRGLTCAGNADPGVFEIHLIPRLDR